MTLPTHDADGHEMGWVLINNHKYWRPVISVADITVDGTTCTVPIGDLLDILDGGGNYGVCIKKMSLKEFERLPEFNGW